MSKPCVSSLSTPRLEVQVIEILDACIWHDVCTIGSMSIFAKLGAMGAPSTWSAQATLGRLLTFTGLLFTLSGCGDSLDGNVWDGRTPVCDADGVIRGDVELYQSDVIVELYDGTIIRGKDTDLGMLAGCTTVAGNLGLGRSREGREQGLDLDYRIFDNLEEVDLSITDEKTFFSMMSTTLPADAFPSLRSVGRLLPEVYGLIGSRRGIDIMFQDIEGFNALEYLGGNFPGACQVSGFQKLKHMRNLTDYTLNPTGWHTAIYLGASSEVCKWEFPALETLEGAFFINMACDDYPCVYTVSMPELKLLDGSFFQDEHHGNSTQLILPKLEEVTGSIRLDHPYHLELPSLRRVGRHFQLDGNAGNSPSSRFDYVLDLSSLEEVGGHLDIWATSLDDFTQVTSLKRVGGWVHLWANDGPFEELQAIADGLESAEAIYLCAPDNCDGLSKPDDPPYPWSPEGW